MKMLKFEVNKSYETRSICDADCIFRFKVISRTDKKITLSYRGETISKMVSKCDSEYFGAESIRPLGNYSMAPILTASKISK